MFKLTVQDVFFIRNRGAVAMGRVESGTLRVGDTVKINGTLTATVEAIEVFRRKIDEAQPGDNVGLLFKGLEKNQIPQGSVITAGGEFPRSKSHRSSSDGSAGAELRRMTRNYAVCGTGT